MQARNHPLNSRRSFKPAAVALTIAGSDCSGGAGLEADLKTFAAHRAYGMAVVTCVVAENPRKVVSIQPMTTKMVRQQISCCLEGLPPVSVKTGMLFSSSIIRACHLEISNFKSQIPNLIIDPVMVATSGTRLLQPNDIRALMDLIADHADLVTPNLEEAGILAERRIKIAAEMETAAEVIARRFSCSVLVKGGHLHDSQQASDFFWNGREGSWFRSNRIHGVKTHGTGCTYSAAITANLAHGYSMLEAIRQAKRFMAAVIRHSHQFGPWMALNHCAGKIGR